MLVELLWRPRAINDLKDIYIAIGLDSELAADRVVSAVESRVLTLREFPRIGPRRTDIAPHARMLVEGSYLILYECCPDTEEGPVKHVEVIRIVEGHRDLGRLM